MRSPAARAALAALGVAVSAFMVLVLLASYRGLERAVSGYSGQPGVDLWAAPRGTDNLIRSSSVLPGSAVGALASVEGVASVGPLIRGFVTVRAAGAPEGRGLTLMLLAYAVPDGLGGPPGFARGRPPSGRAEIALDRAAAWRLGLDLDDAVVVNGQEARIVGITRGTNLIATQFAFVDIEAAKALTGYRDLVSFVAIALAPGSDPGAVIREIEARWEPVSVYTTEQFVANNLEEVGAGFRPMQALVSAVGLLAAAVLVSLLVQSSIGHRERDIAVLFALGARPGAVSRAVVGAALRLVLIGACAGALGAVALSLATDRWLPTLELGVRAPDALAVVALFAAVSALAAAGPVWRLRRLDPVEAFRP